MRKMLLLIMTGLIMAVLGACGADNNSENNTNMDDEVKAINTEYDQPESADVDETVTLKAIVTLGEGGDKIMDADVEFEYWLEGDEDNSTRVEANNNEDGTYTAEVSFEEAGTYEMNAHTDAEGQHTMPLTQITIGEDSSDDTETES